MTTATTTTTKQANSLFHYMRGDPKITGIIFLKWSIRFYTITTLVSFKVLFF